MKFGRVVKKYRLIAGMSQEKLAASAGIHRNYAGAVERGERNLALLNMVRIARALRVPLSQMMRDMESDGATQSS
ncbi:MAG TPA: helix-turn-helix transcriptional regulator [Tepidisphaeraceae bacterium]